MKGLNKFKDEEKENPLLQRPVLAEEAFDHFSQYTYKEASLSAILRNVKISKGSFYFKFYDKMDLYLCTVERLGQDKAAFLKKRMAEITPQDGFFGQLRAIVTGALDFSRTEPRYNQFWRNFMNENEDVKKTVKTAFPEISHDFLGDLIDNAIASGQLSQKYDRSFIHATINLYFNNMDAFVNVDMSEEEMLIKVDEVIAFLKKSLAR